MKKQPANPEQYRKKRAATKRREDENSKSARDIAESCPECVDVEVREQICTDLCFALKTLFPIRFNLPFGPDHLEFISDIQHATEDSEHLVRAMPRGNGKTAILVASLLWSILTGKHMFAGLIGATSDAAKDLLASIVTELESNDQILAYFPEAVWPIRRLECIHQKRLFWNGEPIQQIWTKSRIILPSLPTTSLSRSAIIQTAGLLGRVRGMQFTRPDGEVVRPTIVLLDDPQTDASAISLKQNNQREDVIRSTIPGLAGPTKKVSVFVAVTVKAPDDVSSRMLDRKRNPSWHGKRTSLLRSLPTNVDLWNQYSEIYLEDQRNDLPIDRATEFYLANRVAMDEGAVASWPDRFNDGEASGIQYAMNLKIVNPAMFAAEYQNQPLVIQESAKQTEGDKVVLRVNGRARGVVPLEVETFTAGVDVQKNYLVYTVGGFSPNATPFIVDYGTFPEQKTNHFDRRTSTRTIEKAFPDGDADAQLWAALDGLVSLLMSKDYKREDGLRMGFKKICIDVRYKGGLIKKYIKASANKDVLLAAQGVYIAPGVAGINDREAKPGEVSKNGFRLPPMSSGQIARTVSCDSNEYITKVHDALNVPLGQKGALTLFDAEPHLHRNYVEQLCSEYSTIHEVKGRKKQIWTLKPNGGDNDFLDSTKLMFLAAYVAGVEPTKSLAVAANPKKQPATAPQQQNWFQSI